jgi:hypothetical protein
MKKYGLLLIACIGNVLLLTAQSEDTFVIQRYSPEISFVVMDSTHGAQSTVIEYADCLVLIEMPIIDEGGGKTKDLDEDTVRATRFRDFLHGHFSQKPIRYILSSHWHQHSLSGVTPFTDEGTRIVTTRKNWGYAVDNGLVAKEKLQGLSDKIILVSADTLLLPKSAYPIQVLYLDSTYTHKPTADYLFFYLTRQKYLHASCMTAVGHDDLKQQGSRIYGSRLVDVRRVVTERKLDVSKIIRLGREHFAHHSFEPGIYNYAEVAAYMAAGKSPEEVMEPFTQMSPDQIRLRTDSLLDLFTGMGLPPGVLNITVYTLIEEKEYEKAVLFAQLLNLYYPGDLDFIDTLGEAFYFQGAERQAQRISNVLMMHDPEYSGGIEGWRNNRRELTGR